MPNLKLITSPFSPYGHRIESLLIEKNINYSTEFVDLSNKPQWFCDIAPLGKVPVLLVDDRPLFESLAILEFIEATFTDNVLHPKNQFVLAQHRAWMEFSNTILAIVFAIVFAKDLSTIEHKKLELIDKLNILSKQIKYQPYFNGEFFSILDIAMASAFQPLLYLNETFKLNVFANIDNIWQYAQNVVARPSFAKAIPDNYNDIFANFLQRKQSFLLNL
jgi:glutathione S-transferase